MNNGQNGGGQSAPRDAGSFSELFARVLESENADLLTCLAADLNAFLTSLALLSQRNQAGPKDVRLLFERFRLTLQASPPLARGPSEFAQRRVPRIPGSDERHGGAEAVARELGDQG